MIPLVVGTVACCMILIEARTPGRTWPMVTGWWVRAAVVNAVQIMVVLVCGWSIDIAFGTSFSLFRGSALGTAGGAVVGYLAVTLIFYWWHRARHENPWLWRHIHQMHHSPQRLEIITSFYKHPTEMVLNAVITSALTYLVLGLSPAAAATTTLLTGLAELFYHWNVKTPFWVGFLFQRPESHCLHHGTGIHKFNYSDLPLWDMMFGTFRNPRTWTGRCGFGHREHLIPELLQGKELSRPDHGEGVAA